MVSGFLFIDKPVGLPSGSLIGIAMKLGGVQKAGHAGTLDTNASGLMVIALNSSVRLLQVFTDLGKQYTATVSFHSDVKSSDFLRASRHFTGKVKQLPPRRSAVSRKPRIREVHGISVLSFSPRKATLGISCSSGLYVRRLASDMGDLLGVRAHLSSLRRTNVGNLDIGNTIQPHEISAEHIRTNEKAAEMAGIKGITILPRFEQYVMMGSPVQSSWVAASDRLKKGERACILSGGRLIAIAVPYADSADFHRLRLAARTDTVLKP